MNGSESTVVVQIAEAARAFQQQSTGHGPEEVKVILNEGTLVIILDEALTPAKRPGSKRRRGCPVQEFTAKKFFSFIAVAAAGDHAH